MEIQRKVTTTEHAYDEDGRPVRTVVTEEYFPFEEDGPDEPEEGGTVVWGPWIMPSDGGGRAQTNSAVEDLMEFLNRPRASFGNASLFG